MNFIQAIGVPITIKLAGKDYPVRPLKFRELAPVSAWIEENVPSPLANAARTIHQLRGSGKSPDDITEELLLDHATNAMLSWPPRPGTKAWFDALDGVDGGLAELVYTILSQTIPGFDRTQARELADKLSPTEVLELAYLGVLGLQLKKDEAAVAPAVAPPVEPEPIPEPKLGPEVAWGAWRE